MVVWFHGDDAIPITPPATNGSLDVYPREERIGSESKLSIKGMTDMNTETKFFRQEFPKTENLLPVRDVAEEWNTGASNRWWDDIGPRATPITPPSFLVANPVIIVPGSSSSSASSGDGDGDGTGVWVGGIIALVILVVGVGITCVAIALVSVYLIYKYRVPIGERLSRIRMPSVRRPGSFQEFRDEDEGGGM